VCATCRRPVTGAEPWISRDDLVAHSECEQVERDATVLDAEHYEALMDE